MNSKINLSPIILSLPPVTSPSRKKEAPRLNLESKIPEIASPRPILKTPLSPKKSPGKVEFGTSAIKHIPGRKKLAQEITIPLEPVEKRKNSSGNLIGDICSTTGLLILGDPEEFFEYFHQFSTWEEFQNSLNQEKYQWTGAPNLSGSIIRLQGALNRCLKLHITPDEHFYLE